MYISMGLSQGIMPLISYNYASGNIRRMKQTVWFARPCRPYSDYYNGRFLFHLPWLLCVPVYG